MKTTKNTKDTKKGMRTMDDSGASKFLPEPAGPVDDWARQVIGAAIEVHRTLGPGYLESIYEGALCVELTHRLVPHRRQAPVNVAYRGELVGEGRIDILVDNCLIVELKTVEQFAPIHTAQVLSYLKATGLRLGLLLNFNTRALRDGGIKRIAL